MRRWGECEFELAGQRFRVQRGVKSPDDLRLDWYTPTGWRAVPMSPGAMMADFFFENEDVLYPPDMGNQGGSKYIALLRHAARHGWQKANAGLLAERAAKQDRLPL